MNDPVLQVLIVEDDDVDALLIRQSLRTAPEKMEFVRATSLREARQQLSSVPIDVVVMDLGLPDGQGIENLEAIQEIDPTLPVVILTGRDDDAYAQQLLAAGAQDYLPKSRIEDDWLIRSIRYSLDRKQAEARIRESQQRAERADQAKSQFLANMSHEIRTPMTSILGYAQVLADSPLTANQHEAVRTIRQNGSHLLAIINDILDLSKIESGRFQAERVAVHPQSVVEDVVNLMQVRADEKGLLLEVECEVDAPQSIVSDSLRLRQILINLVGNALKFTNEGGVKIQLSACEWNGCEGLEIAVADSGIGIDEEHLNSLFEPFTQVDNYGTGTGLGLSICKRLSAILGGTVEVSSKPDSGSTFRLLLPVAALDEKELLLTDNGSNVLKEFDPSAAGELSLEGLRVLVAEDGVDNQRLIAHFLRTMGIASTIVENGKQAVEAMQKQDENTCTRFAAVLMDMSMPVMDGYEATRLLRQTGTTTPVIALTAHAMPEDRQRCLEVGCDDFVSKPIDDIELRRAIVERVAENQPELLAKC